MKKRRIGQTARKLNKALQNKKVRQNRWKHCLAESSKQLMAMTRKTRELVKNLIREMWASVPWKQNIEF